MEFTTHLPCTTWSPASIISHLELSIIIGTLEISGSAITKFKNLTMASLPSISPSSILISIIWAPPSTCSRATLKASSNFSSLIKRRNFFEPATFVRSPTFTKFVSADKTNGSNPESFRYFLGSFLLVGCVFTLSDILSFTTLAIAVICSGVVPQQPPTIFTKLFSTYSFIWAAICAGVSSYSPKAFGNPAFGCAETAWLVLADNTSKCGTNWLAPKAQLKPTDKIGIWEIEIKKASAVCPDKVLPEASVMVPLTIMGTSIWRSSFTSSMANKAAFAFKVSKIVSTNSKSAPPSNKASTCCL